MLTINLQDPQWYHALTLPERVAALRQAPPASKFEADVDLAQRRLKRWRSQAPFTQDAHFTQRLAMDGLTEVEFLNLLGEPIQAVQARASALPAWVTDLAQAFAQPNGVDLPTPAPVDPLNHIPGDGPASQAEFARTLEFLSLIEPLIRQGRQRFQAGVQALVQTYPDRPFDADHIEPLVMASLPFRLFGMISRTLALELNVARLQGVLKGDTPQERFASYMEYLRQPEYALALLHEYPVLFRQVLIAIERHVLFALEFLTHLCVDWPVIQAAFSPDHDPGILIEVDIGRGDVHRGGRAVTIAKFQNDFQVVYKPKSMAADLHFQELLAWLNQRGTQPPFRIMNIIDRNTYGWTEFIAAQDCSSPDEVQRFYERQGNYLALLYALEATDFHFENLIAAGEHPVLIDLESLFHPRPQEARTDGLAQLVNDRMAYSVLRIGLLPILMWASPESEGVDLSGLGAPPGQLTPTSLPLWEELGTDAMHLIRKRLEMPGGQNRPTLNGAQIDVLDYSEAILTGFTTMYRLLLEQREALLSETGPLARFADDEIRAILRPTRVYGLMLQESFHPDLLRSALDRDRFFDRLWVNIDSQPSFAQVLAAERNDLLQGDIPMFTARPNSRDVWTSTHEPISDFFDETSLELTRRRLEQMSEEDLERQAWFVQASLTTLIADGRNMAWRTYSPTPPQTQVDRERLIAAACAVGDRLERLALRDGKDVSWIGLTFLNERRWTLLPLGIDLYGGLSGIALFLAHLGAITQQERYTRLARVATDSVVTQLDRLKPLIKEIGAFDGWGGVIYCLAHLGALWQQPALFEEAEKIVEILPNLIAADEILDIISGAAGCIGSLISLYRCAPTERTLAAAVQCGDRLLARAHQTNPGIAWMTSIPAKEPLTGFSHGASGMAGSLLQLAALTGEKRFQTTALEAFVYERSLFSTEANNWPDFRVVETAGRVTQNSDVQQDFMTTWCHGAPGIGLARICACRYLDDPDIRAEVDVAAKATLAQGFGLNHSLCHGDLGNLDFLLQASEVLPDLQASFSPNRTSAAILESIEQYGWLCGTPQGIETPGLMMGIAGIGYGLLRLADPVRIPSVLTLEPPYSEAFSPSPLLPIGQTLERA